MASRRIPMPVVALVAFVSLFTGVLVGAFGVGHNDNKAKTSTSAPVKKSTAPCPFMNVKEAERLTRSKDLNELTEANLCIFVGLSGNQVLGISWINDPSNTRFDQSARAVYCEHPKPFSVSQACWGSKHMDIFFSKKGLLVTVNTDAGHNDADLLDMASAVATNI